MCSKEGGSFGSAYTHIPRNDHAAQLVDDEYVQLRRRLAEFLLKDLQDVLHDFRSVSESHCDVTQRPNGVIWDQMGIPTRKTSCRQSLRPRN